MIDDDIKDQIKDEISAIEDTKVLLGLLKKQQAIRWLERDYSVRNRWGPQLTEEEKEEIRQSKTKEFETIYQEANDNVKTASELPSFRVQNINVYDLADHEDYEEYVSDFTEGEYFQEVYEDIPETYWDIKLIPIQSLVAVQPHVTTDTHTEIPTSEDDYHDLVRYCLPKDVVNHVLVEQRDIPDHSASARFVSRNPNVNFEGPEIESIEDRPAGNISITFNIKSRPNFVQVDHFDDRYILKNGYHRSYQLLNSGEDYIPAVVNYPQHYQDTVAANMGWFRKGMVMGARPPLMGDFLSEAAVTLEKKARNKMVKVLAEKLDVER